MSDYSSSSFDLLETKGAVVKGIIGTAAPLLAVINSFQEQIEWYLRIAGLIGALVVSLLTICSFFKKRK
jgi:hypothetical protein